MAMFDLVFEGGGAKGIAQRAKASNAIIDGGALSNFPIRVIAEKTPVTLPIMGNTGPLGARNLGLLIDETVEFDMSAEHLEALIASGRSATETYLRTLNF